MSYQVDVSFPPMSKMISGLGPMRVPALDFTIELDTKEVKGFLGRRGVFRILKPIPRDIRTIVGDVPTGTWEQGKTGFYLYGEADWGKAILELRQYGGNNDPKGPAFALPRKGNVGATLYDWEGSWTASAKPLPKTWVGIMAKGSGGVLIGAEGGVGALVTLDWATHGVGFCYGAGRVIAGGGFSGGLALVIATGFEDASKFEGFASDGGDWALSFGPNLKGVIASGRLAKLQPLLKAMGSVTPNAVLSRVEEAAEMNRFAKFIRSGENSKEIYGVAKGVMQAMLIDTDYQNVTAIDIPLAGGGAEAGIYYSWSRYKVLSRW